MVAGLTIHRKSDLHLLRWAVMGILGIIILCAAYYGYDWYINGNRPPLVALPATAYADSTIDESPVNLGDIDSYTVPMTHPRYITIPALGITKARVKTVGLTRLNTLDTPRNISDTAWYTGSSLPGQGFGQVVIDGHNGGISRNGIFVNLNKLNNSDKITIERGDGKKFTYGVVKSVTLPLQEANTTGMKALMKQNDPTKEGLGLITCAGKWIPRDKVFDKRILVWAVAE